uniref:Knottin scorpion toxin-like domain-containing protein n=1 Tax=Setaria viridis TaxID=4556 RepID=A0A4U6TJV5_SETVI|nr:hypothetical protein SEVIR_8G216700v2 [Setaria viridis]
MAHSAGKNLCAVLLLVAIAGRIHAAESASVGDFSCDNHLSANYKGPCFGLFNDNDCDRVCSDESSDNMSGSCSYMQCWCQRCT